MKAKYVSIIIYVVLSFFFNRFVKASETSLLPSACESVLLTALKADQGSNYKGLFGDFQINKFGQFIFSKQARMSEIKKNGEIHGFQFHRSDDSKNLNRLLVSKVKPSYEEERFLDLSYSKESQQDLIKVSLESFEENIKNSNAIGQKTSIKSYYMTLQKGRCSLVDIYAFDAKSKPSTVMQTKVQIVASQKYCQQKKPDQFFDQCQFVKMNTLSIRETVSCASQNDPHDLKVDGLEAEMFQQSCDLLSQVNQSGIDAFNSMKSVNKTKKHQGPSFRSKMNK